MKLMTVFIKEKKRQITIECSQFDNNNDNVIAIKNSSIIFKKIQT